VQLQANFSSPFASLEWMVDGMTEVSDEGGMSFVADKMAGESYDVSVFSFYDRANDAQVNNLRRALKDYWGVSPSDVVEDNSSANIQLNVIEGPQVGLKNGKTGIMASLITNLPKQMFFLLEITLTAFVLILSMSLLFALIPESVFEKEKNDVF